MINLSLERLQWKAKIIIPVERKLRDGTEKKIITKTNIENVFLYKQLLFEV